MTRPGEGLRRWPARATRSSASAGATPSGSGPRLGTHAWLWWLSEPDRLGGRAVQLVADRRNRIYLSAASSWELAIKYSLGRLHLPSAPERFVPERMARDGVVGLPVEHRHALRVGELPRLHADPFDRLLAAQGQLEDLTIMTADETIARYDVPTISI